MLHAAALMPLQEPANAQPLLRQGSAGSCKAQASHTATRQQETRHPEKLGTRYPDSRVRVWPGPGSGWLQDHPTRPETNTMKRRAFLESQKTMKSMDRTLPPKRPRLIMEGETVSDSERKARLREFVRYPDELSAEESSSTHNNPSSFPNDGPLAEEFIPDLPDVGPIEDTSPDPEQRSKKTQ
ncbi:hypothetical protein EV360DRAFT_84067, partial [Lentinula raphanica]